MRKHLIYYDSKLDFRQGGPSGYLAALKYGLKNDKEQKIEFSSDYLSLSSTKISIKSRIKKILPLSIIEFIKKNIFSKL